MISELVAKNCTLIFFIIVNLYVIYKARRNLPIIIFPLSLLICYSLYLLACVNELININVIT